MKVGFYYHIPFAVGEDGASRVPAHLGLLIDAIARTAGSLVFYGHREAAGTEDFLLDPELIRTVDLGPAGSHLSRSFRPSSYLQRFRPQEDGLDVVLIQGPSPLLPHLVRAAAPVPVLPLLWGDLGSWEPRDDFSWIRNRAIELWARYYNRVQANAAKGHLVLVNNPTIAARLPGARIEAVPTGSYRERDIADAPPPRAWPLELGRDVPIRLVYSGRIVREKGLFEAVDALALLERRGINASFGIIGWEDESDRNLDQLRAHAAAIGVADRFTYLGFKAAGPELLNAFREADLFVIPTYWDSLPRSMQEAMAMGLPAIASDVGGIGYYLRDRDTAMLIRPRDPGAIADAVEALLSDAALRETVATRGQAWARTFTVEASARTIVDHLQRLTASRA